MEEKVILSKKEYKRLKKLEQLDLEFMQGLANGLEEAKKLRFS